MSKRFLNLTHLDVVRVLHEVRGPEVDVCLVAADVAEHEEARGLQADGDSRHQQDELEGGLAVAGWEDGHETAISVFEVCDYVKRFSK